jgi:hypothetical protein
MIEKHVLEELYINRQLSMMEIAGHLGVSSQKVIYWMRKHEILRRKWSEATYVKLNPDGDPFSIKSDLNVNDFFLLGLGLGLYWGEGTKRDLSALRLANSDPRLIRAFLHFLTELTGVKREKITFMLHVFEDVIKEDAISYWMKEIGFPRESFKTIYMCPPLGKGTYKRKALYGVITITVGNKKLRNWLVSRLLRVADGEYHIN